MLSNCTYIHLHIVQFCAISGMYDFCCELTSMEYVEKRIDPRPF
jgi:hypothetical protein